MNTLIPLASSNKMKFGLKHANKSGSRIGVLSALPNNPQCNYETPLTLTVTKGGSIPHLTQDIIHEQFLDSFPICVPSQHFVDRHDVLKSYNKGVSKFAALKNHPVCVTVQDPTENTPSNFNDKSSISVWGPTGRKKICPIKYSNLIEVMKPDWYESLNDADTPEDCSGKRIEKSMKNSFLHLENCLKIRNSSKILQSLAIFSPLLGGHDSKLRVKWAEKVSEIDVDGYTLLGLHQNGDSAIKLNFNVIKMLTETSLAKLPVNKPKQAQGAFSIISVLTLVENGVDIFDSSLPYLSAEKGCALSFPNTFEYSQYKTSTIHSYNSELESKMKNSFVKGDVFFLGTKKLRFDSENGSKEFSEASLVENHGTYELDLKNKRYFESQDPLVPGCQCYTCRTYKRSYIHHLLSVREMLASILLSIHNLHYWQVFFETIREVVKADHLTDYKNFLLQFLNKNQN